MAVKIGIHGGQQDIEMDELRRMWRFADSNGFDFISLWDHFYEAPPIDGDSPVFEAIAGMAALAAETSAAILIAGLMVGFLLTAREIRKSKGD